MGSAKGKKLAKQAAVKPWQTNTGRNKRQSFTRIYTNMLQSDAYKALTPRQKVLLIACRDREMYPHPEELVDSLGKGNADRYFYMNRYLYVKTYGLYKENNRKAFYRDMRELIKKGFVGVYRSGKSQREKSIYQYCERWKEWSAKDGKDVEMNGASKAFVYGGVDTDQQGLLTQTNKKHSKQAKAPE